MPCFDWVPTTATVVLPSGEHVERPIDELRVGDRFIVLPGERIATDGFVEEGKSAVDASLLTGESMPVDVGVGSAVTGATINVSGRLIVRATRVGSETSLAQMARLVEAAQTGKAPVQRLADRVAAVFVPSSSCWRRRRWGSGWHARVTGRRRSHPPCRC